MTEPSDREDEQWLAALAGNPDPHADPLINQQAAALRQALQHRKENLAALAPEADDALYQQLLFTLRRERITDPTGTDTGKYSIAGSGVSRSGAFNQSKLSYWGLAATLVLGTVLMLRGGLFDLGDDKKKGDLEVVRGLPNATVMIVADPQSRSTELIAGLKAVGAEPKVERLPSGRMKIVVRSSNAVRDYLMDERIVPTIKDEQIILILDPAPK